MQTLTSRVVTKTCGRASELGGVMSRSCSVSSARGLWARRFRFAVAGISLLLVVSGCGAIHLHDEVKATSSKEAVDQYAKIDLQQGIKKREANFDKLEAAYIAAVDKRSAVQRDVSLAIAANDGGTLRGLVLGRNFRVTLVLNGLGIKSRRQIGEFKTAVTDYHSALGQYDKKRADFKKAFNKATKALSRELTCIHSKDPDVKECKPAADGSALVLHT